jgi:hypothetical protein
MKMKISKGGTVKNTQKNIMSLCENDKKSKRGTDGKNNILSLYENKNLKKGDRKTQKKKPNKKTCPYAKIKKIKKGDGRKKPHLIPV